VILIERVTLTRSYHSVDNLISAIGIGPLMTVFLSHEKMPVVLPQQRATNMCLKLNLCSFGILDFSPTTIQRLVERMEFISAR
jgi:hypothetical protein